MVNSGPGGSYAAAQGARRGSVVQYAVLLLRVRAAASDNGSLWGAIAQAYCARHQPAGQAEMVAWFALPPGLTRRPGEPKVSSGHSQEHQYGRTRHGGQ